MIALGHVGMADLEFRDLALLPASGIAECLHAAGIDGCLARGGRTGAAADQSAGSIDPTVEWASRRRGDARC